jgi:hypothetical protein
MLQRFQPPDHVAAVSTAGSCCSGFNRRIMLQRIQPPDHVAAVLTIGAFVADFAVNA